jgi:hypothetical protein
VRRTGAAANGASASKSPVQRRRFDLSRHRRPRSALDHSVIFRSLIGDD